MRARVRTCAHVCAFVPTHVSLSACVCACLDYVRVRLCVSLSGAHVCLCMRVPIYMRVCVAGVCA